MNIKKIFMSLFIINGFYSTEDTNINETKLDEELPSDFLNYLYENIEDKNFLSSLIKNNNLFKIENAHNFLKILENLKLEEKNPNEINLLEIVTKKYIYNSSNIFEKEKITNEDKIIMRKLKKTIKNMRESKKPWNYDSTYSDFLNDILKETEYPIFLLELMYTYQAYNIKNAYELSKKLKFIKSTYKDIDKIIKKITFLEEIIDNDSSNSEASFLDLGEEASEKKIRNFGNLFGQLKRHMDFSKPIKKSIISYKKMKEPETLLITEMLLTITETNEEDYPETNKEDYPEINDEDYIKKNNDIQLVKEYFGNSFQEKIINYIIVQINSSEENKEKTLNQVFLKKFINTTLPEMKYEDLLLGISSLTADDLRFLKEFYGEKIISENLTLLKENIENLFKGPDSNISLDMMEYSDISFQYDNEENYSDLVKYLFKKNKKNELCKNILIDFLDNNNFYYTKNPFYLLSELYDFKQDKFLNQINQINLLKVNIENYIYNYIDPIPQKYQKTDYKYSYLIKYLFKKNYRSNLNSEFLTEFIEYYHINDINNPHIFLEICNYENNDLEEKFGKEEYLKEINLLKTYINNYIIEYHIKNPYMEFEKNNKIKKNPYNHEISDSLNTTSISSNTTFTNLNNSFNEFKIVNKILEY